MDYGELLSATFRISWRAKYLWLFGLFALSLDGCNPSSSSYQFSGDGGGEGVGSFSGGVDFVAGNWGWLLALGLVVFVLGFLLFALSVIMTAGLVAGADEAYRGVEGRGARRSWRRGFERFWPLLGLFLLLLLAGILTLLVLGVMAVVVVFVLLQNFEVSGSAVIALVGLAVLLALALIPFLVVIQIVVSWSARSLILDGTGVFASLGRGWRLFRAQTGSSLLVWALNLGLSIAVGLILAIPMIALGIPLILAIVVGEDQGPWLIPLAALGGLVLGAAVLLLKAVLTTFFSTYWTIAYRKLQGATESS